MTQPIAKFRAGQVSCAVWKNEAVINGNKMSLLKATVERRYKDAAGEWQSSPSIGFSRAMLGGEKMYYERYFKQPNGDIARKVEKQTELAEWEEVRPRCWERRVKDWDASRTNDRSKRNSLVR